MCATDRAVALGDEVDELLLVPRVAPVLDVLARASSSRRPRSSARAASTSDISTVEPRGERRGRPACRARIATAGSSGGGSGDVSRVASARRRAEAEPEPRVDEGRVRRGDEDARAAGARRRPTPPRPPRRGRARAPGRPGRRARRSRRPSTSGRLAPYGQRAREQVAALGEMTPLAPSTLHSLSIWARKSTSAGSSGSFSRWRACRSREHLRRRVDVGVREAAGSSRRDVTVGPCRKRSKERSSSSTTAPCATASSSSSTATTSPTARSSRCPRSSRRATAFRRTRCSASRTCSSSC